MISMGIWITLSATGLPSDRDYSYEKYKDILDAILFQILEKGKGIELNTGGIRKGMRDFPPLHGRFEKIPGAWRGNHHHRQ